MSFAKKFESNDGKKVMNKGISATSKKKKQLLLLEITLDLK